MAHVGCCVVVVVVVVVNKKLTLSTYRIVDKTTYVEVFGGLCICTSGTERRKSGVNVGHP